MGTETMSFTVSVRVSRHNSWRDERDEAAFDYMRAMTRKLAGEVSEQFGLDYPVEVDG